MKSAAILAGGAARRLGGRPKGALDIGPRSILARQLDVLRASGVEHVAVVGRTSMLYPSALHPLADAIDEAGALGGLYTAMIAAPGERVLVLAGDMPFLTAGFLEYLFERAAEADAAGVEAVVPRTRDRWHPLAAVYHRRAARRIKARLDRGALRVTDALSDLMVQEVGPEELARFDPDDVLLLNVNTPDDYERACRHADARENLSAGAQIAKVDDSARM